MIHPTRTNLLLLKDRGTSVANSMSILKARRLALIREFLAVIAPVLESRERIRERYRRGLTELQLSRGIEGDEYVESVTVAEPRKLGVEVRQQNVMGVRYRDLIIYGPFIRTPEERPYDYTMTTPHLEETCHHFETVVDAILEVAVFENKLQRLGDEIQRVTRRIRVLEERIQPRIQQQIRVITQYIGERDREAHFCLKRFKGLRRQTPDA